MTLGLGVLLVAQLVACDLLAAPPQPEAPPPPASNVGFLAKQIDAALLNRSRPAGPCEDPEQGGGSSGSSGNDSEAGRSVTWRWTRYCTVPQDQQSGFVSALETELNGLLGPSGRTRQGGAGGGGVSEPRAARRETDLSARFSSSVDRRISGWLHVLTFAEGNDLRIVIILDEYQARR